MPEGAPQFTVTEQCAADLAAKVGTRSDHGKIEWHYLPPSALNAISLVMMAGAKKYSPGNWERGMGWSRCFNSLMRHMWAWVRGEENDPETGLPHLAHAGCNILFLLHYTQNREKYGRHDDRPCTWEEAKAA